MKAKYLLFIYLAFVLLFAVGLGLLFRFTKQEMREKAPAHLHCPICPCVRFYEDCIPGCAKVGAHAPECCQHGCTHPKLRQPPTAGGTAG